MKRQVLATVATVLVASLTLIWPGAGVSLGSADRPPARPEGVDLTDSSSAATGVAGEWVLECVDCRGFDWMTDRSLRLGGTGRPHIAYGGKRLYYAWHDGARWHLEVADNAGSNDVGKHASLDLDSGGNPHIGYYDETNGDLKYAHRNGAGWSVQTVDSGGDVGLFTSVALDASGYPHISYYDATHTDLKYAYKDGSGWHIQTVDSSGDTGSYTSLALNGGYPHISYYDDTNDDLRYAYKDGTGWHVRTVDSGGDVGLFTSLALNGSGSPHISYQGDVAGSYGTLKHAYRDASGWHTEHVEEGVTEDNSPPWLWPMMDIHASVTTIAAATI